MNTKINTSDNLRDVRYEIRGQLAQRAHEMERQGYEIISMNIGNPGLFGFRTPETMRMAMIENLPSSEAYCHQKGIFPPVDVLPSLSRLMQRGIGEGHTRADHRKTANLLYASYAKGRELRKLEAIVGRDGMTEGDKHMLDFADAFEQEFVNQSAERRTISETLDRGIGLLRRFGVAGE